MPPARTITISGSFIARAVTTAAVAMALTSAGTADVQAAGAMDLQAAEAAGGAQFLPTETRWSVAVPAPPAGPPVIAGGVVAVPLQSGLIVGHRTSDSSEAWRTELTPEQPLATDGATVFVSAGETVHALNAADGAVAWRAPIGAATGPLLAQQGWVIVPTEGKLTALRAADGSVVWARETGAQRERASFEGDQLYVPLADGRLLALDLKTGATRWERALRGAPAEVLPLSDRVYVGTTGKYFYALDAADGEVEWHYAVRVSMRGQPALAGDRVIAVADNNELRAFDRNVGALRWRQGLPFRPTGGPVVFGTAVLAPGTVAELHAYHTETRREVGTITFGQPLASPFAVGQFQGGTIIAAVTGTLTEQWNLVVLQVPVRVPSLPIATDFTAGNWQAGMESIGIR